LFLVWYNVFQFNAIFNVCAVLVIMKSMKKPETGIEKEYILLC